MFTYTVADGRGAVVAGRVFVNIRAYTNATNNLTIENLGDGSVRIHFSSGIPGRTYTIQYTASLTTPDWQVLTTAPANPLGTFEYTTPANLPTRFYRTVYP
jgi:hypothetical protein